MQVVDQTFTALVSIPALPATVCKCSLIIQPINVEFMWQSGRFEEASGSLDSICVT